MIVFIFALYHLVSLVFKNLRLKLRRLLNVHIGVFYKQNNVYAFLNNNLITYKSHQKHGAYLENH